MDAYKQLVLLDLLTEWFKSADFDNQNFTSRDKVANLIKTDMKARGRWKNKARGKPRKFN